MGLLKSVIDVPGIDFYDYRDSDYYNKYTYRVRFKIFGIRYIINEKNVESFMKRYNATTGWRVIKEQDRPEIIENLEALKQIIELRNSFKKDGIGIVRLEWNTVAVFSNDLSLLKSIENIKSDIEYDYTQVRTNNFVGVKSFVRLPKHKFRVYLKSKMVGGDFAVQLNELLNRDAGLYPCTSLKYWIKGSTLNGNMYSWRYRFTNATHFIDYDDETLLSYLALMHGEYLGKRYKLEKRPEPI
jgi:hypothetical protein